MSDVLAAEIEGIVDKQLQDCGFIDLCTRCVMILYGK